MAVISPYYKKYGNFPTVRGTPNGMSRKRQRVSYPSPRSVSTTGSNSSRFLSDFANVFLPAAATAINPMLGLATRGVQTAMRYARKPAATVARRGMQSTGRFTGYIKRSRLSRRKSRKIQKKANNSYMFSVEKSGSQTPSVSAVLGHSTISRVWGIRMIMGAMLRHLFYKAGIKCNSPTQAMTPMVTGTVIRFWFQYAGASNDNFSLSLTAPITFKECLDAALTAFDTKYDTLSATQVPYDLRFRNMSIESPLTAGAPMSINIDLVNAKLSLWCSSRLKIQNRSINSAGNDEADDVDNVPINCISYSGFGTGLDSRYDYLGLGLCANQECIISTSDPVLAGDAPLPSLLNGVKKSGFIRIQPGGIKTDVLKHKVVMSLDSWSRHFVAPRGNSNLRMPIGKFSFMHYEKTLEANNATPVAMSIAYENQLFLESKLLLTSNDIPIPEFVRS